MKRQAFSSCSSNFSSGQEGILCWQNLQEQSYSCQETSLYFAAVASASTGTDPGTSRASSADQQMLEPKLPRTVINALVLTTAQNVMCTAIVERELFFPISKGNTEKTKFSIYNYPETSLNTTTDSWSNTRDAGHLTRALRYLPLGSFPHSWKLQHNVNNQELSKFHS